jgi:hypothetical protein
MSQRKRKPTKSAPMLSSKVPRIDNSERSKKPLFLQAQGLIWGALAIFLSLTSFLALFLPPEIQTPTSVYSDQALSLPYEIANTNVLPILDLRYACVVQDLNGPGIKMYNTGTPDTLHPTRSILWGREKMTAECQDHFELGDTFENASVSVELSYYAPPIPWRISVKRVYKAIMDPKTSKVLRWVPE